jgi:hypothetical protein
LFQFYEGYFYYKYRLCIRVNLEIKGAENKSLETNNKLGFVYSLLLATNTRVEVDSPWETLLALSLLVTGKDWDFG